MTAAGRWQVEFEAAVGAIAHTAPIASGDINDAWRVELADRRQLFVKTQAAPPPGLYAAEAAGLAWIAAGPLRVPRVIAVGASFLALEWLELGGRGGDRRFHAQLGRGLAELHALGAPGFGLDRDNYLATLPQDNTAEPALPAFWIERRLRPTIARLSDRALVARLGLGLDRLAAHPERFGPPEPPARLHGDLWWGNVSSCGGAPVIFDPAVYGGHREIDLAMLSLFGSVDDALIGAYHEVWPLADDWRDRRGLWQLYPLAVHAVLFGGDYPAQLAASLAELVK
ncbi:MAG TPA: fructosamine kinase family protein [Kofleriaceae bacterium]|jgi:fructosamine-3-kinase|nr:fructosamine kinase family protein [Kofleriaceae bacterium]